MLSNKEGSSKARFFSISKLSIFDEVSSIAISSFLRGKGDFKVLRGTGVSPISFSAASIPVATTETRIVPSRVSSKADPTRIFALGSTLSRILFAASSTSNSVKSVPPVILISTPRAPSSEISSNKGLLIACSAA